MACTTLGPAVSAFAGDENMPLRERISDIRKPTDLTVTGLAKALPYSWAEQEQIGLCL
jgi:hypothetical protein